MTLVTDFATGGITVGLTVLLIITFLIPMPEHRKKKWKKCPSCHRWSEAK